ncbi:hypothetical protein KGQ20_02340 [Catenulispora sp. NF23]|uniref:Resolvase/invertase-type recombinase catalytic domain-containing protein n=1 Tax=Catenulispora pinistramenti TaxID=2705254 RepID=A0ABS5KJM6_9ACTN|nr:hypothetical protein [Catenulispora pinistramenti]MBS2531605.1 hypothetical protein [Catenulispora pinistramenti]MBS2546145.1 hypothetical protein [Catenulispora pinistramenti]
MARITERQPVGSPVVFGYLRGPATGDRRDLALSAAIKAYCDQHELFLGGVFTERVGVGDLNDSVFANLIAELRVMQPYGVVLPSRSHLGPPNVAVSREEQISTCGALLIAVR